VEHLRGFFDILKQVKHQKPQLKFCPSCMSTKIYPKESYGMFPPTYSCRDCDYEGYVVLEKDPEDQDEASIPPKPGTENP
jgi:predicted RNA-binding Zn-ribbon protein involved in translation (DUF1610 family)